MRELAIERLQRTQVEIAGEELNTWLDHGESHIILFA
jgi:hypothetical protein